MKSVYEFKKAFAALLASTVMLCAAGCTNSTSSNRSTTSEQSEVFASSTTEETESFEFTTESTVSETTTTESTTETTTTETTTSERASVGASNVEILDAAASNTALSSGEAQVSIGDKQITVCGAYVVDGVTAEISGGTYASTSTDQNVFLVINGGCLKISNAEIEKTGDAGENDATRTEDVSDDYNFYGINSVILVVGEGSSAEIRDCTIHSDCSGANAVFSTASATATVNNVDITTTGNSSRGVYATYEGSIDADAISITTSGAHCAPIATDRGGGFVTVKNSLVNCSGDGSPCIYSTGEIMVENVVGTSTGAQAAVIEGKNSITMTNCDFTVSGGNNGIMLYQSMSGDAADQDATNSVSTLTMTGTTIQNTTEGAMLYITNTNSVVNLNGGNTLSSANGMLVNAATGNWGNDGSNGGTLTLNINGDEISDSITADDISSVTVNVASGSFSGTTSGNVAS